MKDSVEKATTLFLRFIGDKVVWSSILSLLVSALLAIFLLTTFKKTFDTIDERIGVLPWTFFPDTSMEERITLVAIDEESLAEIGPWPWSRSVMADLISKLMRLARSSKFMTCFTRLEKKPAMKSSPEPYC